MWYASSALTNTTGKQILNQFKYPVTLTYVQFGFVAGLCFLSSLLNLTPMAKGGASTSDSSGHMKLRPPSWTLVKSVSPMAAFQIFGHVFSSLAISRVPVSFAHTIKALSPLFTVALYRLFYNINYPLKVYLALMPLTFGVMLVCISELTFNVFGFLCALTSTLIFVVQNMYTKDLFVASAVQKADPLPTTTASTQSPDFQPLDKLNLLFYSSGLAFLGMFPLWLSSDASSVIHLLSAASPPPPTTHPQAASGHPLLILFILNGLTHFFQNIIAFHLLSLVSPVTYSVASLVKRIFVICASIVWFGQHVDARQGLGIAITFLGLWIYQGAKRTVEEKDAVIHPTNAATNAAARRRRKILLLPK
ncbi:triose-phosphate transporter family-domain-containing protein [Fimicolochytrium jonesii]|uniref:triose-phosphate transporter family-domain-containing protein n=1 Tax=Fimicolochytrium jonesii TaxID=1396493 RepID=UPI0022FE27E4|nr:triose-phosphate transporter family-domain-containing protein [Fimicolochytrium jonesii]KAI8821077.1 triose-phosphate transporter family-domain-containing protein [Fimicolochytrium jonesii]